MDEDFSYDSVLKIGSLNYSVDRVTEDSGRIRFDPDRVISKYVSTRFTFYPENSDYMYTAWDYNGSSSLISREQSKIAFASPLSIREQEKMDLVLKPLSKEENLGPIGFCGWRGLFFPIRQQNTAVKQEIYYFFMLDIIHHVQLTSIST